MNEYFLIVISIAIAFVVSIIFTLSRGLLSNLTSYEKVMTESVVGWTILVFGLILSFSIVNFYSRYIDLRNSLAKEATNLDIIYKLIRKVPNSEKAVEAMKKYLEYLIHVDLQLLKKNKLDNNTIDDLYSDMNDEIINLINESGNVEKLSGFSSINILSRLSTNYENSNFRKEIINNTFYINVIIIMAIFILISLWLVKVQDPLIQFLADLCFLSVIFSGITLLIILGKPFNNTIIGIDLSNHKQLLDRMNKN